MKIICLIKFIPDVDSFEYDRQRNVLVRENVRLVLNPDDACALGFVLGLKKKVPELEIEAVTMAPLGVKGFMEDILRRNVDRAVMLCDKQFSGSDTLATSRILGSYLRKTGYDVILTGCHSLDGDTAHIPSQLAEFLGMKHLSGITHVGAESFLAGRPKVTVDTEKYLDIYELSFPAILSVSRESNYRLPFVRYRDLDLDVRDRLHILDNTELGIDEKEIGWKGSPTKVVRTYHKIYEDRRKQIVRNDEAGIETVYQFLKKEGYL